MKRALIFIISLSVSFAASAKDIQDRTSNILRYGKWFVIEFTMPNAIAYRVGTESNLSEQQQTVYVDISPLNKCSPDKVTVNQFIGNGGGALSNIPFLPIKYKVSGQEVKDSITVTEVSNGYLFTPINSMKVSELLKANGKGNFSFWIQPPAESNEPINKILFPLNGFSNAYKKAVQLCSENI